MCWALNSILLNVAANHLMLKSTNLMECMYNFEGYSKKRTIEGLHERTEHLDIFLFFPPITQWYSISDVLFTGGRGVSDFSVLKYY